MVSFKELNLPEGILRSLDRLKFVQPTPIQAQSIPVALTRRDLVGIAQTGTGKTAAFCIPILVRLLKNPNGVALVLAPTRELALQIEEFWKNLAHHSPEGRCAILIGGMAFGPQIRALRNRPRLIVATPGRLCDHLERGTVSLSKTEILVLDEADRMLDMGFAPQLDRIHRHLPKTRQTLLFSATWAPEVDRLSSKYVRDPAKVSAGAPSRPAERVSQSSIGTTTQGKNELLLDELNQTQGLVLVFARTQKRTDRLAKYLASYGLEVNRLHGGLTQGQRRNSLDRFKNGTVRILVATDIAARGIDVTNIQHVINYDLPQVPEDYVHRIGRTARAGAAGHAVSLVTPEERGQWRDIIRLLKSNGSRLPQHRELGNAAPSSNGFSSRPATAGRNRTERSTFPRTGKSSANSFTA